MVACPQTPLAARTLGPHVQTVLSSQFCGILPILLENPESRPMCDQDRKNPDFDICSDFSNRVYLTETDIQKTFKTARNIK